MNELLMQRRKARPGEIGLFAVDELSFDELMHVPAGRSSLVKIRAARNPKQHALIWALAKKLADNVEQFHDAEDAMEFLKIKARHVRFITDPVTGEVHMRTKSIAFASLDQMHFARLFDRFIYIITSEIIPSLDSVALRSEILAMVEGDRASATKPAAQQARDVAEDPAPRANEGGTHVDDHLEEETASLLAGAGPDAGEDGASPSTSSPDEASSGDDAGAVRAEPPPQTHSAEQQPPRTQLGAAGGEVGGSPPGLSADDRDTLRLYHEHMGEERAEVRMRAHSGRFWGEAAPAKDSPLGKAAIAIYAAHMRRVRGEVSIAECDRLAREARV